MTDNATNEQDALLPCPFCGEPAEYDSQRYGGGDIRNIGHAIYCPRCLEMQYDNEIYGAIIFSTKRDAFEYWNIRHTAPSPRQEERVGALEMIEAMELDCQQDLPDSYIAGWAKHTMKHHAKTIRAALSDNAQEGKS